MGKARSSKTNNITRKMLDMLIEQFPQGHRFDAACICTKVNAADKRRRYDPIAIGSLLRERSDLFRRTDGTWTKL